MAEDDDEVVMEDSELHKYLNTCNFSSLNPDINLALDLVSSKERSQENCDLEDCNQLDSSSSVHLRIEDFDYRGHFIKSILKTGLLYPDHLFDIENLLSLENGRSECLLDKKRTVVYSSLIVATLYGLKIVPKQLKTVLQIGFCLLSGLTISHALQIKTRFNEKRIVEEFVDSIETLFSLSRKCLNYIKESELTLRNRIVKQQPFYVSEVGWINSDVSEAVLKSGLLLPELRKQFYGVLKDLSFDFSRICKHMRNVLHLTLGIDNNSYYVEIQNCDMLNTESIIPSLEELKKVYNLYLLTQSEFLRRLLLSFVNEFWEDCNSSVSLHSILKSLVHFNQSIKLRTKNLELVFQTSLNFITQQGSSLPKRDLLKSKQISDKIYTIIGKFVTKTDAQLLALISDLRMIDDWLRDCEENNKTITDSNAELLVVLHQRISFLKGNIDTFNAHFNDSLNILLDLTKIGSKGNNIEADVESVKPNIGDVTKTGVEVGKSDFNPNGEDEIFISLSGPSCNTSRPNFTVDESELEVQRPLPKNVLLELKCALQGKREEWIEREKRALGTSVEELDLDGLRNPDTAPKLQENDFELRTIRNTSEFIDGNITKSTSKLAMNDELSRLTGNAVDKTCPDNDLELNYSLKNPSEFVSENYSGTNSFPKSFIEQIKFAQEKFNLNASAEEYIEEVFD